MHTQHTPDTQNKVEEDNVKPPVPHLGKYTNTNVNTDGGGRGKKIIRKGRRREKRKTKTGCIDE